MSNRSRDSVVPVSEPAAIMPTFVDELVMIDPAGAVTNLLFTVSQLSSYDGSREKVVQCRLIVPTDRLAQIGKALLAGRLEPVAMAGQDGEPVSLQ